MAFRTKNTYTTGQGSYNTKNKTYSGKGSASAGYKKVAAPKPSEVPTVTTDVSSGRTTTSGFPSQRAAIRAKKRRRAAVRTERRKTRALNLARRVAAKRRAITSQNEARVKSTEAAIQARRSASRGPSTASKASSTVRQPANAVKPPKFAGRKTAGTPTLKSLRQAKSQGKLKVNQRGYLTTPAVRKTASKVKLLESKARNSSSLLPGLTPQASHVAHVVLARGAKAGATRKEKLAAAETGLVESGFENLPGGDADSEGWRQERSSLYPNPRNVKASASRFFQEAKTDTGGVRGRGQTAGQLAQTIQGSAYPKRYDERKPEANAILKAYERGSLTQVQRRKLASARKDASRLGLKGLTKGKQVGPAPKKVVTRYKAIKASAKALEKMNVPYVYGGGHGAPGTPNPSGGLDCSSSTVYLLNKAGVKVPNITSGEFGNHFPPGPGAVTIFYNPGHVFLRIGEDYYGTSVGDSGAGGLGYHPAPGSDYLAQYSVAHVPGLGKKQALQLGISAATPTSFPGMSLSSSGTTATIESGATISGKPGFSSKPIKLTQALKARRTYRQLREAGVGTGKAVSGEEATSPTLRSLEAKYGVKTG